VVRGCKRDISAPYIPVVMLDKDLHKWRNLVYRPIVKHGWKYCGQGTPDNQSKTYALCEECAVSKGILW
jgi:hypothetical protein